MNVNSALSILEDRPEASLFSRILIHLEELSELEKSSDWFSVNFQFQRNQGNEEQSTVSKKKKHKLNIQESVSHSYLPVRSLKLLQTCSNLLQTHF